MWLYRAILTLGGPFVLLALVLRILRGQERWSDLLERLGRGPAAATGAIWLHGASNGELTSARPLIDALQQRFAGHPMLITCNTLSGRDLVRSWALDGAHARLAPLDSRLALRPFLQRWRPAAQLTLENEIWPNRIALAKGPVLFASAKISDRSSRVWSRFPGLRQPVFGRIDDMAPQDEGSAARFKMLGVQSLGPIYAPKSAVTPAPPDPTELARLQAVFAREDTLLAASTHEGEDEFVLDALAHSRASLRLILAPRHPKRAGKIRKLAQARGLSVAQRSTSEAPTAQVYIADTLGEMPLWYSLAGITFVGGSLVDKGGHTPFEPIAFNSAVVNGPNTRNFSFIYSALTASDAAICVTDTKSLAQAILHLSAPKNRHAVTKRASRIVQDMSASVQDTDTIVNALAARLGRQN